jgi:hypothetical protein
MSICNTAMSDPGPVIEPLVVKPKVAWKMLACSNTRGYELLAAGELDSFLDGRSRKVTVESIHRYIQRHLGSQKVRNNPMHGTSKEIPNGNADLVPSSTHRGLTAAGAKIVGDVA